jgi:hypothetical protein
VVDNIWKFSKHHPTCNDGKGNINNIIDTSNYKTVESPKPIVNEEKRKKENKTEEDGRKPNGAGEKINPSRSFNNEFPSKKEMFVDATTCPEAFVDKFNVNKNSRHLKLGTKEYVEFKNERCHFSENNSFMSIPVTPHVNLNHLSCKPMVQNHNVLMTSSVQRVRNKFLTLVYYKPIN